MKPVPSTPINIPALAKFEDHGNIFIDPKTGSSYSRLSAYIVKDDCDQEALLKLSISASINDLIDCVIVPEVSVSLKVTLPHNATEADFDTAVAFTVARLKDQINFPYQP